MATTAAGRQRKANRRQLDASRDTLLTVYETEDLTGEQLDAISAVRHLLAELLDARAR